MTPPTMMAEMGTSNPPKLKTDSMNLFTRPPPAWPINQPATAYRFFGGADRDRTGGLLVANQALSQLSYSPNLVLSSQMSVLTE
jgi:hypothetical protein